MQHPLSVSVISLIITVAVGATASASAVETTQEGRFVVAANTSDRMATMSDANIFAYLNAANTADIEGRELAQQKASNPQVKAFGSRMLADHSGMIQQGQTLGKRVMVNPTISEAGQNIVKDHMASMQTLNSKLGSAFDQAYINHEVQMHERVLRQVEKATQTAQSPELKELLKQAQPALQSHLETARDIQKTLMATQ